MQSVFNWVVFALLLGACGAPEEVEQTEPDYAEESDIGELINLDTDIVQDAVATEDVVHDDVVELDIGELEQAIFAGDGYGFDGAGKRCNIASGWSGGKCSAPDTKSWQFYLPVEVAGTPEAAYGCTGSQIGYIDTAMQQLKARLNAPTSNWNITSCKFPSCFSSQTTAGGTFKVKVACSTSETGGTNCSSACGQTKVNTGLNYSCEGNSPLQFCQYKNVDWVRLYPNRMSNISGWSGMTNSQRGRIFTEIALHELLHVTGLGHSNISGELMGNAISSTAYIYPTDFELLLLRQYNFGSGTNPAQ